MTRLATKTATAAIASAFMAVSVLPAEAMPAFKPASAASENIQTVQYRGGYHDGYHGGYRNNRGYYRGNHNHGRNYYNGYDRRYYKQKDNDDAWVPLAILGAGALIIGGAIAANNNNNRVQANSGINPRHFQWCYDKYRSYRSSDNTFQPYNGPRQQCYSPYY